MTLLATVAHDGSPYSRPRVAPFMLAPEVAEQLSRIGSMTGEQLLTQLEGRAYVVLIAETGRADDMRLAMRLGLCREYSAQYRHILLWSEVDQAFRVVVYAIAYSRVVLVVTEDCPAYALYERRVGMAERELASTQANAHARGEAPPPYEVLISWLTSDGRPMRRIYKLAKLVGVDGAISAFGHDDLLAAKALLVAADGIDVRITVRNQRIPAKIALEFTLGEVPHAFSH